MKRLFSLIAFCGCLTGMPLQAQTTVESGQPTVDYDRLSDEHPRYLTTPAGKQETLNLIAREPWAKETYAKLKQRVDGYVEKTEQQPDWLYSRLAMYWHTHATEVYIKGENFDHAGGDRAPVPTVRFTGTRGTKATHGRPKLEDVIPYDDDANSNVTFRNNALPDKPMERVHPSKTGRNIESLNREIMGIARDAAFLWWLTDDERYARMAAGVFDTYMPGIYYRGVPIDLNHGHQQTLVGMSSMEVIHEDILHEIVELYDFLHPYLKKNKPGQMDIYAGAFKKWADNIIANGVPHNNWNLMQARYVMNIGMILEDDDRYADGRGRGYYIDYVLNQSSIRQWSLKQLAEYGYDYDTGIWAECPGYSNVVLTDYVNFTQLFDRNLGFDLTRSLPVIPTAVASTPQHLFPNRMICGWGDTHPGPLSTLPIERMIQNAQVNGKVRQEAHFTALLKCLKPELAKADVPVRNVRPAVSSFFGDKPLTLNPDIAAGKMEQYVSPVFYAPNVSWLIQRNGMDARHSLMASLNASMGNHMHANGISLELYGKGYVLGPDAGIGQYMYSGLDYAEYYSQFPAHNTVCVDGISSYPVMKSNHAFKLLGAFPKANAYKGRFFPVTYSDIYFLEPETQSDQRRLTSVITVGEGNGYYVDIFRSRKQAGGDKIHDYFYHNLGQQMTLRAADGTPLNLQPTEELAFAGAHLYAYSYLFDKKKVTTSADSRTTFTIAMPGDADDIHMNLWMKGSVGRSLYQALSPMTEGYSRTPGMPYDVKSQPTLTFVARQTGEAWNRPFVAVYEPTTDGEPSVIRSVSYPEVKSTQKGSHVAIKVEQTNGRNDVILSSDEAGHLIEAGDVRTRSAYAVCGTDAQGPCVFLMARGTLLYTPLLKAESKQPIDLFVERRTDGWYYHASGDCRLQIKGRCISIKAGEGRMDR